MEKITPYFEKQVFVCLNHREGGRECCADKNAVLVHKNLKEAAKQLGKKVRVSKSGCQNLCEQGVVVSIYPDNIVYSNVTEEDVEEIIEQLQ